MKAIIIYCKKCKQRLTGKLIEIELKKIYFPDFAEAIPEGRFVYFKEGNAVNLYINRNQPLLKNHKDTRRFIGCCGSSGMDGMNKVCINNHEVATEFSDCYTSYYTSVSLENTIIEIIKES